MMYASLILMRIRKGTMIRGADANKYSDDEHFPWSAKCWVARSFASRLLENVFAGSRLVGWLGAASLTIGIVNIRLCVLLLSCISAYQIWQARFVSDCSWVFPDVRDCLVRCSSSWWCFHVEHSRSTHCSRWDVCDGADTLPSEPFDWWLGLLYTYYHDGVRPSLGLCHVPYWTGSRLGARSPRRFFISPALVPGWGYCTREQARAWA